MSKFLTVVGQLKFRGTSVLFRLPHSPVKHQTDPYNIPSRPTCPSPCPSPLRVKLRPDPPPKNKDSSSSDDENMEVSDILQEPRGCKCVERERKRRQ